MKRRLFFRNLTLGTAGTLSLSKATHAREHQQKCDSGAKEKIKWHMATSWPTKDDITFESTKYFCEQVDDMTDGEFKIEPHLAGDRIEGDETIPALDVFSEVQSGDIVQCGHTASYYYLDQDISLAFRTGIPFGLNPYQQYAWFYQGKGYEIMQEVHGDYGLLTFLAGSPGCQMGGWFKEKVNDEDDLKGRRIRIPGFGAEVIESMGAEAFPLGGDQVKEILNGGKVYFYREGKTKIINKDTLDAIEWQNPYDDEKLGLYNFAQYYYYPGFWEPGTTYEIIINQKHWNNLSSEHQAILKTAAATTNLTMLAEYDAKNGEALNKLKGYGVKLERFSNEILERAYNETFALLQERANKYPNFGKIYVDWKNFRNEIFQWNWYNELAFDRFFYRDE